MVDIGMFCVVPASTFSANTTAIAIASVVHRRKDAELLTIVFEADNRLATRKSRRTSTEAH